MLSQFFFIAVNEFLILSASSVEIDLLMPLHGDALFDGRTAGWVVYGPGSAHRPTVSQGRALVLYLLPAGEIVFTA